MLGDQTRIEPDKVREVGKQMWSAADDMAATRVADALYTASVGMHGTDLVTGLGQRSTDQNKVVQELVQDLETFGDDLRKAAEEFERADDQNSTAIRNSPSEDV